jgi:hypothetical protein
MNQAAKTIEQQPMNRLPICDVLTKLALTGCGGDAIPPGTFRGGDAIPPGTFRGGDAIPPGTFRAS